MSSSRSYLLDSEFDRVSRGMRLRQPQRESLRVIHDLVTSLPEGIRDISANELLTSARELDPTWRFRQGHVELTFAIATGVGKTRLMGAIAAYLFRTGESTNFLILAPRDAILRKVEAEAQEASDKYIFYDRGIVPQPRVCHRGNILDFDPRAEQAGFLPYGPNLFVLSPQILQAEERIARPSPFLGYSILEYLRRTDDLIVFVDESHHLSQRGLDEDLRSWSEVVKALKPKLVCSMTGTPREEADIAYQYDLKQCLRDRLYTKAVRLIVDEQAEQLSDAEYDAFTLDAALDRLRVKVKAIEQLRITQPSFPQINPIILVAAQDTAHADEVFDWLKEKRGLTDKEVLLIHSRRKTEADLERLAEIDLPNNEVRVVIQVHVLDEGWDVTNVYVIAPLRNVQSYINARQVMGRGLRLPMGVRTDETEVDTLDVLAFGQETFADVYAQATAEFGKDSSLTVEQLDDLDAISDGMGPIIDDRPRTVRQKRYTIHTSGAVVLEAPLLDMIPPEPNLEQFLASNSKQNGTRKAFDLGSLETQSISGSFSLSRERFVRLCVNAIIRDFYALSAPLHEPAVRAIVEGVIGSVEGAQLSLDPILTSKVILDRLSKSYVAAMPSYVFSGNVVEVSLRDVDVWVNDAFRRPVEVGAVRWSKRTHSRLPIAGWNRCTHVAARFDTEPEFEMAKRLDHMQGVSRWMRNDPPQFTVETIAPFARMTSPDFLVTVNGDSRERVLLLEIKGEHLWGAPDSAARVHARDLTLWVNSANEAVRRDAFAARVLLGGDVSDVVSLTDIERLGA